MKWGVMQLCRPLSLAAAVGVGSLAHAAVPMSIGVPKAPPFAMLAPDGSKSGLYVELIAAIAAQSGADITVDVLPLPRLRQYLKTGELTAVLGVPNAEMLDDSILIGNVTEFEITLLGAAGSRLQSMDELLGKRICLSRGTTLVPELYADKRYLLTEVSNHESCPRMLDAGRVDYFVSIPIGLPHLLAKIGKHTSDYGAPFSIKRVPVQLLLARVHANAVVAETLRQGLQRAKASGLLDAIQKNYETP